MPEVYLCKDCFYASKDNTLFLCTHKSSEKKEEKSIDLVTGEEIKQNNYYLCSTMRRDNTGTSCGPEGIYYLPKEEEARKIFEVERTLDGNATKA